MLSPRWRIGLIAAVIVGGAIVYLVAQQRIDVERVIALLRTWSGYWWTPLVYFAAYSLCNLLFLPPHPLSIAAVVIWGWSTGGTIELLSATVGAIFPYLIARRAAGGWIETRLARHKRAAEILQREGFTTLLLLRAVPIIPYTLMNWIAGAAAIRPLPYLAATFIGTIPSVYIFAYFVDALLRGIVNPSEVVARIVIAGALLGALVIGTKFAGRRIAARLQRSDRS